MLIQVAAAEVTRDEFGGYCCKRWTANSAAEGMKSGQMVEDSGDICELLGLDIEKLALKIVQADQAKHVKKRDLKEQRHNKLDQITPITHV